MKSPSSPFVRHNGRTYLIANFQLEPSDDTPHLHDVLSALLAKYDPADILLARPLSPDEAAKLEQTMEDAEVDFWARLVVSK